MGIPVYVCAGIYYGRPCALVRMHTHTFVSLHVRLRPCALLCTLGTFVCGMYALPECLCTCMPLCLAQCARNSMTVE